MTSALATWLLGVENRLVFVPTRTLVATPEDFGLPYQRLTLTTEDGVELMAWEIPQGHPRRDDAPWLIYFHGNGENVSRYLEFTTRLHGLGLNVLMPEYRGYGESQGVPSEEGLYRDATAAYLHLRAQGVPAHHIVLYGFSLGSGVAIELASKVEVGALIAEAAFTSIAAVARAVYRMIPERMVRNRFASIEKISGVRAPVLFFHSRADLTVPYSQGRELYLAANTPKAFAEITGGHPAMLTGPPPARALDTIGEFIATHVQTSDLARQAQS